MYHPALAAQRCGWLENTKTGYWYLTDPQNRWTIAEGADYEAEGFDLIEDIYSGEYEPLNRYYGYACACLDAQTDDMGNQITKISSYKSLPISACEANENLPPVVKQ